MKKPEDGPRDETANPTDRWRGSRDSFEKRLRLYALAVSAAGAGVLATAPAAQAEIVFTPAHLRFTGGTLFIDLNHDGINDFRFTNGSFAFSLTHTLLVNGDGYRGAGVIGQGSLASALPAGAMIGPDAAFRNARASLLMAKVFLNSSTLSSFRGKWPHVTDKFLGLRFLINGKVHYGWAEFSVSTSLLSLSATLLGYAYDTVPNEALTAGQTQAAPGSQAALQPATLGLLARGSLGLAARRRREV